MKTLYNFNEELLISENFPEDDLKENSINDNEDIMDDLNQNWWIDEIDNDNKINEDDDNLNNNNDGYLIDYEPHPKKRRHIDIESNFIKKLFEDE